MEYQIYLAGAIEGYKFNEINNWRDEVSQLLPSYIRTLSPLRGKIVLNNDNEIVQEEWKDKNELTTFKAINTRDHNDVMRCDLLFVNLLGTKRVSIGTMFEIAWAWSYKKPIVLIIEENGNLHDHPMVNTCSNFIVRTLKDAVDITVSILSNDDQLKCYKQLNPDSYPDFCKEP